MSDCRKNNSIINSNKPKFKSFANDYKFRIIKSRYLFRINSFYILLHNREKRSNCKNKISEVQKTKLIELMDHLKQIQDHVNIILNNKNSIGIFRTIQDQFTAVFLGDDLSIDIRNTDLLEETRRLSYVIGNSIKNDSSTCDIEDICRR